MARIGPTTYTDVENLIPIDWTHPTSPDLHTEIKKFGNVSYLNLSPDSIRAGEYSKLRNIRTRYIKATDPLTGDILGTASYHFQSFDVSELPIFDLGKPLPDVGDSSFIDTPPGSLTEEKRAANEKIARLDAMEDADMQRWVAKLMPKGCKCIVITGIRVVPAAQGKGVGTAMLKWATDKADEAAVYMWVHASEAGRRLFEKGGFEELGSLEVDLDEWAPQPRGDGEQWGTYVLRYMQREEKGK